MKSKIGVTETSAAAAIYAVSPFILSIIGINAVKCGSGEWINTLVCFAVAMLVLNFPLVIMKGKCVDYLYKPHTAISGVLQFILTVTVFIYTCINFNAYTNSAVTLSFGGINTEYMFFIPCFAAALCAILGIEAVTRSSYILLLSGIVILAIIVYICVGGIDIENALPIFGIDKKQTFFNLKSATAYCGLASLYLLVPNINGKNNFKRCIRKSAVYVFGISILLSALFVLCVPYPMAALYKVPLEALFSSEHSGIFFHRFEIFLLTLLIMFDVISTAFGLYVCSGSFSRLSGADDSKMFVLILAEIVYFSRFIKIGEEFYFALRIIMLAFVVILPFVSILSFKGRRKNENN